jgi:hypothetical protein
MADEDDEIQVVREEQEMPDAPVVVDDEALALQLARQEEEEARVRGSQAPPPIIKPKKPSAKAKATLKKTAPTPQKAKKSAAKPKLKPVTPRENISTLDAFSVPRGNKGSLADQLAAEHADVLRKRAVDDPTPLDAPKKKKTTKKRKRGPLTAADMIDNEAEVSGEESGDEEEGEDDGADLASMIDDEEQPDEDHVMQEREMTAELIEAEQAVMRMRLREAASDAIMKQDMDVIVRCMEEAKTAYGTTNDHEAIASVRDIMLRPEGTRDDNPDEYDTRWEGRLRLRDRIAAELQLESVRRMYDEEAFKRIVHDKVLAYVQKHAQKRAAARVKRAEAAARQRQELLQFRAESMRNMRTEQEWTAVHQVEHAIINRDKSIPWAQEDAIWGYKVLSPTGKSPADSVRPKDLTPQLKNALKKCGALHLFSLMQAFTAHMVLYTIEFKRDPREIVRFDDWQMILERRDGLKALFDEQAADLGVFAVVEGVQTHGSTRESASSKQADTVKQKKRTINAKKRNLNPKGGGAAEITDDEIADEAARQQQAEGEADDAQLQHRAAEKTKERRTLEMLMAANEKLTKLTDEGALSFTLLVVGPCRPWQSKH